MAGLVSGPGPGLGMEGRVGRFPSTWRVPVDGGAARRWVFGIDVRVGPSVRERGGTRSELARVGLSKPHAGVASGYSGGRPIRSVDGAGPCEVTSGLARRL